MISFEGFRNILNEKGIGLREFYDTYKIDASKIILGKMLPSTDTVERLCNILQCDISDLISYKKEQVIIKGNTKLDYDKVQAIMKSKGLTAYRVGVLMGKNSTYLNAKINSKSAIRAADLPKLLSALGCNLEDIQ